MSLEKRYIDSHSGQTTEPKPEGDQELWDLLIKKRATIDEAFKSIRSGSHTGEINQAFQDKLDENAQQVADRKAELKGLTGDSPTPPSLPIGHGDLPEMRQPDNVD